MAQQNRRIVLARRPHGAPQDGDFRMETRPVPQPEPGEVLLRTVWLSLDPYMRGRMNDVPSYVPPQALDEVMVGGTVSRVVESRAPGFAAGDWVEGRTGWQEYAIAKPASLRKLRADDPAPSTAVGVLGMPGMTAWCGLHNIGKPQPGETVVVAAASGPVGSMVGQIAKLRGARAVGIAGGAQKCAYVTDTLGFDACIDHRDPAMADQLAAACPKGIDVYFENVGGAVWNAVLPLLNPFARVPVCGLVANYNATGLPEGGDRSPLLMRAVLSKRLLLRGFIVFDFADQIDAFLAEAGPWLESGKIKHREDITHGLEHAVGAFRGMLHGDNFGKALVQLSEP